MGKTCILILLDGLGDRPHNELENKTPLQAAHTPVLDHIADYGANGLYHAGIIGQALPSENAHFAMFGYDAIDFPGRGALEALGCGTPLGPNDVAVLAHLVSLKRKDNILWLEQGQPEMGEDESSAFFSSIEKFTQNEITITVAQTRGFRGNLMLKGRVSPFITDTDPFVDGRPLIEPKPLAQYERDVISLNTAKTLKKYIINLYQSLEYHSLNQKRKKENKPVINGIVTQRPGRLKPVACFKEKYGLKGCMIASGIVYHGLAKYLGMDSKITKDSNNPGEDIAQRIQMAYALAADYDFIHVHTKAPDEMAHAKDPVAKMRAIESLDQGIGKVISRVLSDPDIFLIIASDHSTPSAGQLVHSGEPVPVILHGQNVRRDLVSKYDEIHAANGILGQLRGKELIYLILNHLDRTKLVGIMDSPEDQPYWPGNYEPFKC